MRRKSLAWIAGLVVLTGVVLFLVLARSRTPLTVTLRVAVMPREQSQFVAALANSMKFKYLAGKQSRVKPALAQKLTVLPVPDSPQLEARIGVLTRGDGLRYEAAFVQTLQFLCGTQAQVVLASQAIR